jgi:hypothetical protein
LIIPLLPPYFAQRGLDLGAAVNEALTLARHVALLS